jgi:tRNA 2-thiocytidine biosynthesis protein TtcA
MTLIMQNFTHHELTHSAFSETKDRIRKLMVKAIAKFSLIDEGDKVMVCTSGGKDSSLMLMLLKEIQAKAPYTYHIEACLLDQKQPGFDASAFKNWVENDLGIKLKILERDTYSIVKEKITDGVYCSLCSRMRRAILYDFAALNGFTKIALGHHRDDANETLLLNLFYTGKLSSMPPKLLSDDKRHVVIRPMIFVPEKDIISCANYLRFPIIPCNLCGSQKGLKRKKMKRLIKDLEVDIPNLAHSMMAAQGNVKKSHLMDTELYDFENLSPNKSY